MAGSRKLEIVIAGDAKGATSAFKDVDGGLSKLGDGVTKFAKIAAVGFLAAGAGMAVFAKSAIGAASDLSETISKSNTIFGENAKAIDAWSKKAAGAIGQSRKEALDAAATFGNLFVQLGVGTKQAAGLSTQMVELASDFASFHNAAPADVIEAMTAAFRGEYDAVQRYVPVISAAVVEQKALEMTGKKTTKMLTAQDKALATQQLLLKGAGDAMGDFARTSDGLANKQRILKARFADIQAEIGMRLLPIVTELAGFFLDKLLPAFSYVATEISGGVAAFVAAFRKGDGDITSSGLPGFLERLGNIAREVFNWLKVNVPVIINEFVLPVLRSIGGFIESEVVPGLAKMKHWFDIELRPAIGRMVDSFKKNLWPVIEEDILPALGRLWKFIKDPLIPLFGAFAIIITEEIIPAFFDMIHWIDTEVVPAIRRIVGPIAELVGWVSTLTTLLFGGGESRTIQHYLNAALPKGEKFTPGLGANPGESFVPGRAMGGPVGAGRAYMVGERGPEMFVPGRSGSIVPNGGTQVIQLIVDGKVLASAVVDASTKSGGLPIRIRAAS